MKRLTNALVGGLISDRICPLKQTANGKPSAKIEQSCSEIARTSDNLRAYMLYGFRQAQTKQPDLELFGDLNWPTKPRKISRWVPI